jgi:DNA polymerase epsilon subunit 1
MALTRPVQVANPVPRVRHPDWLLKRVAARDDRTRQARISDSFAVQMRAERMALDPSPVRDMEDFGAAAPPSAAAVSGPRATVHRKRPADDAGDAQRPPAPNLRVDYSAWVAHAKVGWRQQREARRQLRIAGHGQLS